MDLESFEVVPNVNQFVLETLSDKELGLIKKVNELIHGTPTDINRGYQFLHDGIARPTFVQLLLKVNPAMYLYPLQTKPIGDCTSVINLVLSFIYQMLQTVPIEYSDLLMNPKANLAMSFRMLLSDHTLIGTHQLALEVLNQLPVNDSLIELIEPLCQLTTTQHISLSVQLLKRILTTKETSNCFIQFKCMKYINLALFTSNSNEKMTLIEILVSLFKGCDDSSRIAIAKEVIDSDILKHGYSIFTCGSLEMKTEFIKFIIHVSYAEESQEDIIKSGILPLVISLLSEQDTKTIISIMLLIQSMTENHNHIEEFIGVGIVSYIRKILQRYPESLEQKVVIIIMDVLLNISTNERILDELILFKVDEIIEDVLKNQVVDRVREPSITIITRIKAYHNRISLINDPNSQEQYEAHEFLGRVINIYKYKLQHIDETSQEGKLINNRIVILKTKQNFFVQQYNKEFDISSLQIDNVETLNLDIYLNVSESLEHCNEILPKPKMEIIQISGIEMQDLEEFYFHQLNTIIKKNTEIHIFKSEQKYLNIIDQFVSGLIDPLSEICSTTEKQTYFNVIEKIQTIIAQIQDNIPVGSKFDIFLEKYLDGLSNNALYKTYAIFINAQDRNTFEYPLKIAELVDAYEKEGMKVFDVMAIIYQHITMLHDYFDILIFTHKYSPYIQLIEKCKEKMKIGQEAMKTITEKINLNYLSISLKKINNQYNDDIKKFEKVLLRYHGLYWVTMILVDNNLIFLTKMDKGYKINQVFDMNKMELIGVMQSERNNKAIFTVDGESTDIIFFLSQQLFDWKKVFREIIKGTIY
ncbi:hypothetical protein EDI_129260 [Entamoeba dispar SAW760]|uniref:PH domain-containing protein n=1 Tax=Entamoeba dispar (strain ATCC PRA-260 / SAW760) TaxID=370354 RepID=B0ETI8_ENTDS|nr:uncharacterized protein EDI_129260 [Entamoeba dispar SAW760]EDR22173.1 hypothetical protein EDI_129260 [Entamoeba dispar SAW760]|eukprot:EDR22173.1 hypothetical protein EDI_129260 [Entamoeba dispar SAW760]